jgi:DNA alkylation damage repair protein AlkB
MLRLGDGCLLLRDFASPMAPALLAAVQDVAASPPLRRMATPRRSMSVAMAGCGIVGWTSDKAGYRYSGVDPLTGRPGPEMPAVFRDLAAQAAEAVGFAELEPDSCLLNDYQPGGRVSLHQNKDQSRPGASGRLSLARIARNVRFRRGRGLELAHRRSRPLPIHRHKRLGVGQSSGRLVLSVK